MGDEEEDWNEDVPSKDVEDTQEEEGEGQEELELEEAGNEFEPGVGLCSVSCCWGDQI